VKRRAVNFLDVHRRRSQSGGRVASVTLAGIRPATSGLRHVRIDAVAKCDGGLLRQIVHDDPIRRLACSFKCLRDRYCDGLATVKHLLALQ
jgi:hypothetical protein